MIFNSFAELIAASEALLRALPGKRKQHAEIAGRDTLATIKSRIIETGINAEGAALGPYSSAVVPYWYYSNKPSDRDARAQAEAMRDKVGYFASYKDWREQHGLLTDKVTTVFTGEMWKSITATIESHDELVTVFVIQSGDEENEKKLGYLSARYGDLLRLSQSEQADIQSDDATRILNCIEQFVGLN